MYFILYVKNSQDKLLKTDTLTYTDTLVMVFVVYLVTVVVGFKEHGKRLKKVTFRSDRLKLVVSNHKLRDLKCTHISTSYVRKVK